MVYIGPLLENGIVGMHVLGALVRETVINAHKTLCRVQPEYTHP